MQDVLDDIRRVLAGTRTIVPDGGSVRLPMMVMDGKPVVDEAAQIAACDAARAEMIADMTGAGPAEDPEVARARLVGDMNNAWDAEGVHFHRPQGGAQ